MIYERLIICIHKCLHHQQRLRVLSKNLLSFTFKDLKWISQQIRVSVAPICYYYLGNDFLSFIGYDCESSNVKSQFLRRWIFISFFHIIAGQSRKPFNGCWKIHLWHLSYRRNRSTPKVEISVLFLEIFFPITSLNTTHKEEKVRWMSSTGFAIKAISESFPEKMFTNLIVYNCSWIRNEVWVALSLAFRTQVLASFNAPAER